MQHQLSIAFEGVDSDTPANKQLCAKYRKSFAYYTVKDRLPVILTKVINELATNKAKIIKEKGEGAEEDLKSVIGQISKLKNELVTNKSFIKLSSKGEDVAEWNDYFFSQIYSSDDIPCWYYSPWLYAECYMYRRLWEIFENSQTLQDFDPFYKSKEDAFNTSLNEIKSVGKITLEALTKIETSQSLKEKFLEFLKISLWSNRCDLSLSNGEKMSQEDCLLSNVIALNSYLLSDDSSKAFELLNNNSNGIIDFINDNSSYEVFCDFCFCDFLCTYSLASKIRFHVKKIPWYVSDTTRNDITWLLNRLEEEGMEELSSRWKKYIHDGIWSIYDEKYWTMPFDYSEMKSRDPKLYNFLSASSILIFKGDLNYRKLLGDINWDFSDEFDTAIREFKPTNILSLRTVKADLICGVNLEKSEVLSQDNKWMRTGEYAVIQLYRHT